MFQADDGWCKLLLILVIESVCSITKLRANGIIAYLYKAIYMSVLRVAKDKRSRIRNASNYLLLACPVTRNKDIS